jgi:hypothetical protein
VFDITIQCPSNVIVAEIWPTVIRSRGIGISWFAYFVGAITYTAPSGVAYKTIGWRMYMVFLACNIVSTIVVYFYLPETANKTMEEMGDLFGDDVMTHITSDGEHFQEDRSVEELGDSEKVVRAKMIDHHVDERVKV